ncbi:DUF2178 domain-containing protein [Lysinibacillus sp. RC79]|uniref:DUF2178 domain-containing protein n=1 Tax=Lysinibacillus sp. RC79 TaxID=3156296 RepID=UPI003518FECE
MKVYNKKGFVWGVMWTILGVWTLVLDIIEPNDFLPGQIKNVLLSVLLIAIGISGFIRAFSRKATQKDLVEEQDERNRLIMLKSKARTLDILFWCLIVIMIGGLVGYIITKNIAWGFIFIVPGLLISFYWIAYLITLVYYEKHE